MISDDAVHLYSAPLSFQYTVSCGALQLQPKKAQPKCSQATEHTSEPAATGGNWGWTSYPARNPTWWWWIWTWARCMVRLDVPTGSTERRTWGWVTHHLYQHSHLPETGLFSSSLNTVSHMLEWNLISYKFLSQNHVWLLKFPCIRVLRGGFSSGKAFSSHERMTKLFSII